MVEKEWAKNVYWRYSILIEDEFGMSRDELMSELEKKGIETRTFFVSMHEASIPEYGLVQWRKLSCCRGSGEKGDVSAFKFGVEGGGDKVYL